MRDTYLVSNDGSRHSVSTLPTETICSCLLTGIRIEPGSLCTVGDVLERLRIELVAREIEGRL